MSALPAWMTLDGADCVVRVKAVPGASRDAIAGPLGDRLKVRVAAPPEGGRANEAIAAQLAAACGIPARAVVLESGPAQPQKTFRLRGAQAERVASIAG